MIKTKNTYLALITVLLSPMAANAIPITYDFTVTAPDGPLAGMASGSFTFDSSIIPLGGGMLSQTNLLSDVQFTWDGIDYTAATANTGLMGFLADGTLDFAFFGNNCFATGCSIRPGFGEWTVDTGFNRLQYAGPNRLYFGSVSAAVRDTTIDVPEPGTLTLFGIGLLGLGLVRRKAA